MDLKLFNPNKSVQDKKPNNLSRAFIHSLEGGIYLLEIEASGVLKFLKNSNDNKTRVFRSLHQAKECARKMNIKHVELAMNTAYDQMIGLASCS